MQQFPENSAKYVQMKIRQRRVLLHAIPSCGREVRLSTAAVIGNHSSQRRPYYRGKYTVFLG